MLETFTVDTFAGRVGEVFQVSAGDDVACELRLASVTPWGPPGTQPRQPFTLLFHGPLAPVLPQSIYGFRNDAMGEFELFIVPVGPDGGAMGYEAVFS